MERSIHDNTLLSFTVDCRARRIVLSTAFEHSRGGEVERTDIVFEGVTAYRMEGDNFSTILSSISEVSAHRIFEENRELFEANRPYGWPGFWNESDDAVREHIQSSGVAGFILLSAVGMAGWVWATSMRLEPGRTDHA